MTSPSRPGHSSVPARVLPWDTRSGSSADFVAAHGDPRDAAGGGPTPSGPAQDGLTNDCVHESPENRTLMHTIIEIGRQACLLFRYGRAPASGARRDPLVPERNHHKTRARTHNEAAPGRLADAGLRVAPAGLPSGNAAPKEPNRLLLVTTLNPLVTSSGMHKRDISEQIAYRTGDKQGRTGDKQGRTGDKRGGIGGFRFAEAGVGHPRRLAVRPHADPAVPAHRRR
jgi:hypothetical protein